MESDGNSVFRNFLSFITALVFGCVGGSIVALILGRIPIHVSGVYPAVIAACACYAAGFGWRQWQPVLPYSAGSKAPFFLAAACLVSAIVSYISLHWWDYAIFCLRGSPSIGFYAFLKLKAAQPYTTFSSLGIISSSGRIYPEYYWFVWSLDFVVALIIGFIGKAIVSTEESAEQRTNE